VADPSHAGDPRTPPVRRWWWTALQLLLLGALFVFIAREVATQRAELRAAAASIELRWQYIAAASAIVLATYAALIQSWRVLMSGWGSTLSFGAAVRIWTIANLGRYIPGKVWSVGALVVLAQREGVNSIAAAGAALLGTAINIGAGMGVVALFGTAVLDVLGAQYRTVAAVGSVVFVLGVLALPWLLPRLLTFMAARRPTLTPPTQPLPSSAIWLSVTINVLSWVGYGAAFALLSHGVLPDISGALPTFVAIWTASYLVGYLFLVAPGGIGARETALVGAMVALGVAVSAEAAVLAAASRLWLIVLEVLPGLISLALAPAARKVRS
jgi:uncharacterized membrane protein YbhN (UPF0104 family)